MSKKIGKILLVTAAVASAAAAVYYYLHKKDSSVIEEEVESFDQDMAEDDVASRTYVPLSKEEGTPDTVADTSSPAETPEATEAFFDEEEV